jgi:hypothetical protein
MRSAEVDIERLYVFLPERELQRGSGDPLPSSRTRKLRSLAEAEVRGRLGWPPNRRTAAKQR